MKTKDKLFWAFGAVFLIVLIVWGICSAESDFYNYDGYVIDIKEKEKNQTVITTISGNKTSEFVLKWSSRKKYEKDVHKIAVGDRVMLSTARFSNVDIKKIDVHEGYFTEGKLVYVNEAEAPLILTEDASTGLKHLVSIDYHTYYNDVVNGATGNKARVYHAYPIHEQSDSVLSNAYSIISDESALTLEEIAWIEAKGYTVKE
ncbi:MAG: hypothetical protein IKM00_08795 [Clostridia bacterium]|nr:hypothetical protein [Clostridia bacterium]